MKLRKGFVSNSSSSSFIIAFPHKPKSVEELKTMMFGKQEWHWNNFGEGGEEDVPTQQIAENVFAKIKKKATKKEMIESVELGWFDSYREFPGHADTVGQTVGLDYSKPEDREKIEKIDKENQKENHKRATKIIEIFRIINGFHFDTKSPYFVIMEFCDNDGETIEEHTNIFHRLEHIRTSYH